MILLYIIYFTLLLIFIGSLIYRIIADVIEYFRSKPEEKEQPFTSAQITINRRESSGLTSFALWYINFNGEYIGNIKDGSSITVTASKRVNLLEAKDTNGTQSPPLKFFVESGCDSQVVFNNGRFKNPQGMNIILPSDEGYGKTGDIKPGRPVLIIWILLIGYYTAVLLLSRVHIAFVYGLSFLAIPVLGFAGRRPYLDLVDYLSYNYPDEWSGISRSIYHSLWNNNLIFHDTVIGDPEYLKLKIRYEGILGAQIFSFFACIAAIAYVVITVNK